MTEHTIQFGSKAIDFQLEYRDRKTLGITVTPELDVIVKAPTGSPLDKILAIVRKRTPWILRQQSFFLAFYPKQPSKRHVSGETHYYLGRHYRLKVELGKDESVKMVGKFLHVVTTDRNQVEKLLNDWYLIHARERFEIYTAEWVERFRKYRVRPTDIKLQSMTKRWGSCTPKGKIILNPELIKAPKGCILYVIVHELCHLVHHSHNQKFLDLQSKELPTWERWKERLEGFMA